MTFTEEELELIEDIIKYEKCMDYQYFDTVYLDPEDEADAKEIARINESKKVYKGLAKKFGIDTEDLE